MSMVRALLVGLTSAARATVAVAALNQGGRVELQMVAVRSR